MDRITRNFGCFIVFRSCGSSYPSAELSREIGLDKDSYITVFQDETKPNDFYVCKSTEGLRLKMYQQTLVFHARNLARKIGRHFGVDHKKIKVYVGPKTTYKNKEVFPLITAMLKFEI